MADQNAKTHATSDQADDGVKAAEKLTPDEMRQAKIVKSRGQRSLLIGIVIGGIAALAIASVLTAS